MSAHIRTDYSQSDRLFASRSSVVAYAALGVLLVAAPYLIESYYLSQLVFVLIYAIVGVAMNILSGQAGQVSIGHAAFLAIGAYSAAIAQKYGVPLPVYLVLAGAFHRIDWLSRRAASVTSARHLPCHRNVGLRVYRRGNSGALGKRHARQ